MSESKGLLSGKKGESLFHNPLVRIFKEQELPDLFKKTEKLDDERLLAIVTALIIEDRLDLFLGAFLPRYNQLKEPTEFGFSLKIRLAAALGFIPPRILLACHLFRGIRNDFAHNLNLEKFDDLEKKRLDALVALRADIYSIYGAEERKPKSTVKEEFKALAYYCILGLEEYRENVTRLREYIEGQDFLESFANAGNQRLKEELELITPSIPAKTKT